MQSSLTLLILNLIRETNLKKIDDKYIDPSSTTTNSYRTEYFSALLNYQSDPILLGVYQQNKELRDQYVRYFCL